MRILKKNFNLDRYHEIELPNGAAPLHVDRGRHDHGTIDLWYIDPTPPYTDIRGIKFGLFIIATGHPFPSDVNPFQSPLGLPPTARYVGTVIDDHHVWHVFLGEPRKPSE